MDFNRSLARSRSKKCLIPKVDDFSKYKYWPKRELCVNSKLKYHVKSVLNAISMDKRKYSFFSQEDTVDGCIIFNDSHNEIEKLGSQVYFKGKSIVLSMDNFMDIAMQKCCKSDPVNIRKIRDYETISFLFMNCALHQADPAIYVNDFYGYDKNLDTYLSSCSTRYVSDSEDACVDSRELSVEILRRIYYGVLTASTTILLNCVGRLCNNLNLTVRSQGFSNFVLGITESSEVNIPVYIDYADEDVDFRLPVLILKKWEYINIVNRSPHKPTLDGLDK